MSWPTPPEIAQVPELAMLASAQLTLDLTARALVAANPELVEQDDLSVNLRGRSNTLSLAWAVLKQADILRVLLDDYAALSRRALADDDVSVHEHEF